MLSRFKLLSQRVIPIIVCIMLTLLLAACTSGTASTATPTTQPSPTATPTTQPSPTPSPPPAPDLTTYKGNGYSISYPKGWKAPSVSQGVTFTDATGIVSLSIIINPNPNEVISASTFTNTTITEIKKTMSNSQTVTLPATTTVGGENWVQKAISGTITSSGIGIDMQTVILSDNHPANTANTQNFTIDYVTLKESFAAADTNYFQPMLRSFKFS